MDTIQEEKLKSQKSKSQKSKSQRSDIQEKQKKNIIYYTSSSSSEDNAKDNKVCFEIQDFKHPEEEDMAFQNFTTYEQLKFKQRTLLYKQKFREFLHQKQISQTMYRRDKNLYRQRFNNRNPKQLVQNDMDSCNINYKTKRFHERQKQNQKLKKRNFTEDCQKGQRSHSFSHLNQLFQNKEKYIEALSQKYYMPKPNSCDWSYLNNYLTQNDNVYKLLLPQKVLKRKTEMSAGELNDITQILLQKKSLPPHGFTRERPANKRFYQYILQVIDTDDEAQIYQQTERLPYAAIVDDEIYQLFDQRNLQKKTKAKLLRKSAAQTLDDFEHKVIKKKKFTQDVKLQTQNDLFEKRQTIFKQKQQIALIQKKAQIIRQHHPEQGAFSSDEDSQTSNQMDEKGYITNSNRIRGDLVNQGQKNIPKISNVQGTGSTSGMVSKFNALNLSSLEQQKIKDKTDLVLINSIIQQQQSYVQLQNPLTAQFSSAIEEENVGTVVQNPGSKVIHIPQQEPEEKKSPNIEKDQIALSVSDSESQRSKKKISSNIFLNLFK